jgi:hypothetical protein
MCGLSFVGIGQGEATRSAGVLSGMQCGDVVALNGPVRYLPRTQSQKR